jgi:hypothetical protein
MFVVTDINVGLLLFMAMSSLGVYAITLGGWASNNKYALLGGLRSSAQMILVRARHGPVDDPGHPDRRDRCRSSTSSTRRPVGSTRSACRSSACRTGASSSPISCCRS